jgi:hypothetical protein
MWTRISSAVLAVVPVLAAAGPAHAQVPVRSKLTLSRTIPSGDRADEREIEKVRFTTKDFLALLGDSVGSQDLRSLVLERSADPGADVLDVDFLSQPLAALDSAGARVELGHVLQQGAPSLDRLGPQLNHVSSVAKRGADGRVASRTDTRLQATSWDLRHTSDDPVALTVVGPVTAKSRRKSLGSGGEALVFTSRSAAVNGSVSFPLFNPHGAGLLASGRVAGTLKAAAERAIP